MFVTGFPDFVLNNQGHGSVGERMDEIHFDPGYLRPWTDERGRACVTVNTHKRNGKRMYEKQTYFLNEVAHIIGPTANVHNATSLRKDDWKLLDDAVISAFRDPLRVWADLAARNTYGGFDGMAKLLLEHETMSDPGEAHVNFEGVTEGRTDSPLFQLEGLPLPIIHSDFTFTQRRLATSRNSNTPLDTIQGEAAARRVGEKLENMTIHGTDGPTYGITSDYNNAPTVYGMRNYPDRVTKVNMTAPTGSNGPDILTSWLELIDAARAAKFYGPYIAYTSTDYDVHLDNLFSTTEPSAGTLRSRLLQIGELADIRRANYLTNTFTVILMPLARGVSRAVIGMPVRTLQWVSQGGMRVHYKVMTISVPQFFSDYYGNCGVVHGTTA